MLSTAVCTFDYAVGTSTWLPCLWSDCTIHLAFQLSIFSDRTHFSYRRPAATLYWLCSNSQNSWAALAWILCMLAANVCLDVVRHRLQKLSPIYYHWLHTHRWHLHVLTIRLPPHVRRRLRIVSMRPRSRCAWKSTFSPAIVSKAACACPARGQSSCRVQCMQVPAVLLKVRAAIHSSRRPCRIISSSPPSGHRYCHISLD
jgi:hypothetical protein